jgi:antitoxin (DNA-binding transcriptional repressor) of toxin-antitoxin stability system
VVITNHGLAIARLVPPAPKTNVQTRLKALRKNAKIGDIISPIDVEWDALK